MAMIFLGATSGIFAVGASRIFGLDFDLFNPDEPAIQEPTMSENLWIKPMMVVAAVGFGCWKMLKTNEEIPNNDEEIPNNDEEIPNEEPLIGTDDEDQTEEIPDGISWWKSSDPDPTEEEQIRKYFQMGKIPIYFPCL